MPLCAARTKRAAALLFVVAAAAPALAQAQGNDVAAARDAYDRGAAAYDAGEYSLAAQQLQKADALVANDVALELALKASVKANDALLAMELAARADGRQSTAVLAARDDARVKMGPRTGRVTVTCPPGMPTCTSTFDDAAFPVGKPRWVLAGQHRVVIVDSAGGRQAFQVRVDPSAAVEVAAQRPAPLASTSFARPFPTTQTNPNEPRDTAPPSTPPSKGGGGGGGLSPLWFWFGTGVSAAFGGATIASAVDTQSKHDAFTQQPSQKLSDDGFDAQLRTNLLLAGTTASLVVTAAMGLFFVKWGGSDGASPSPSPPPPSDAPAPAARSAR